jgi:hypothetical protein
MRKQLEIDAMQKVSLESVTLVTDTEEAVLVNSGLAPKSLDSLITILEGVWHGECSPHLAALALNTTSICNPAATCYRSGVSASGSCGAVPDM